MKRYGLWLLLILLTFSLVLAGCGGSTGGEDAEGSSDEAAGLDYPTGNIELVVGWGAGGGTDNFARAIAEPMSRILGQTITVVNMPGASGANAGDYVTRQPADGYTLWAISSNYPLNVALGRTPHDLSAYIPVARVQHDVGTLQVTADSGYETIDDLIEAAKNKPGQITVGGTGAMGFDEIIVRMFEREVGVEFNYVPYEDAGQMRAALLGGHIDAMFEEFGPTIALIEEGSIVPLIAFAEGKIEEFPDVPTAVERGWNITDGQARGILAPAGTPQEIIDLLEEVIEQAKDDPKYKEYEQNNFLHLRPGYLNSADFTSYLDSAINNFSEIVESLEG